MRTVATSFWGIKPGLDEHWCRSYAQKCMQLKLMQAKKPSHVGEEILSATQSAFRTVYRAVAFDIDGTLTRKDSPEIDERMAKIIGGLLRRSVPVLLITGRGRRSAREAAMSIREMAELSRWYARRLYCITHNGIFLLCTPVDDPARFLEEERAIGDRLKKLASLKSRLEISLSKRFPKADIRFSCEPCSDSRQKPHSIRIVVNAEKGALKEISEALSKVIFSHREYAQEIHVSRGSYGTLNSFDVAATNKLIALGKFAKMIGVREEQILRVGDRGQKGGNDYDLLRSKQGFSVDEFSADLGYCHPVLDEALQAPLKGAAATEQLLRLVLLFPPLSIEPEPTHLRLSALRNFEKMAVRRSRQETESVEQRLRVRLRYLLPEGDDMAILHSLKDDDICDPRCGAVRFRDWELGDQREKRPGDAAIRLFGLDRKDPTNKDPKLKWCMYSDTGILMRGPNYYYAWTHAAAQDQPESYVRSFLSFLDEVPAVLHEFLLQDASLTRFKLLLAICDNVRNFLIQLQHAAFVVDGSRGDKNYGLTWSIFRDCVLPHTRFHFRLLMDPDADWYSLLQAYGKLVRKCRKGISDFLTGLEDRSIKAPQNVDLWRNWRECDHFLQNITAVQLGLHELRNLREIREQERLTAVGLVYGGTELPAIARVVAESRGFKLNIGFLHVSIYGDRQVGRMIRQGDEKYVRDMLVNRGTHVMFDYGGEVIGASGRSVLLLDDNCTTCVTMQLARDVLVLLGADVLGAITVRFPGGNRHVQMALPGHGYPDPEALFGFIRGLLAPSPYTRLMYPNAKGPESEMYLDQSRQFDKSKDRIKRYLEKNGTPPVMKTKKRQ